MADARQRLNRRAAGASIATAPVLIAIKLWAQLQTGAVSVPASLADSAVDLLMAIGALWAIRYAARREPPLRAQLGRGHRRARAIGGGGGDRGARLRGGRAAAPAARAAARRGRGARGHRALARDHARARGVPGAGRAAHRVQGRARGPGALPRRHGADGGGDRGARRLARGGRALLDPLLAALWIARLGLRAAAPAVHERMDREAAPGLARRVDALAAETPGVRGWPDLETRASGGRLFVQLHVEIDGDRPRAEAHRIGEVLRRRIQGLGKDVEVMIHHDPV